MSAPASMPPLMANGRGRLLAALLVCGLLQAASLAAAVALTRLAIDRASEPDTLAPYAIGLAVVGLATALGRIAEKRLAERIGLLYVADLRIALLEALARLPGKSLETRRKGAFVLRYTGDLSTVRSWIGRGVVRIIVAGLSLPALLAALALVSQPLALAVGVVLAAGLAATLGIGPLLQRRHHSARAERGALSVRMAERAMHPLTLRFASSLPRESDRLRRLHERVLEQTVRRGTASATVRAIPDAAGGLALAIAVYLGAQGVATGDLTVGGLVAAVAMIGLAMQPLREIAGVQDRRRAFVAARDRVLPILHAADDIGRRELKAPPRIDVDIAPAHENGRPLTVTVPAGAGALVTGAGKSALLEAIVGLRTPDCGRIRVVDGVDDLNAADVAQASIGYVSLRTVPFKGRVKSLLRLRNGALDEDACNALLERAGAAAGLKAWAGLGTKVGEGGANIPLPLRLRLLLAIALAGEPKLIVVDDADLMGDEGLSALVRLMSEGTQTMVVSSRGKSIEPMLSGAVSTVIDLDADKDDAARSARATRPCVRSVNRPVGAATRAV